MPLRCDLLDQALGRLQPRGDALDRVVVVQVGELVAQDVELGDHLVHAEPVLEHEPAEVLVRAAVEASRSPHHRTDRRSGPRACRRSHPCSSSAICPRLRRVKIAVARETREGETRVAMVPELVGKLTGLGYDVAVEPGAGRHALISDEEYADGGRGRSTTTRSTTPTSWSRCSRWPPTQIRRLRPGAATISFLPTGQEPERGRRRCATCGVDVVRDGAGAADLARPVDGRAVARRRWSSGYRCAIVAAGMLRRFFPLNMTAAGTVPPAEVVVLGAGVAGLQAIATAKRLGAVVKAYDVRAAAAEEIRSMGAQAIDLELDTLEGAGGYAREMTEERAALQMERLAPYIAAADALITTAAVPGRQAPLLVTARDGRADEARLGRRRPGRRVRRQRRGRRCAGEVVRIGNAQVWGGANVPSQMPGPASRLYAQNIVNIVTLMTRTTEDDGRLRPRLRGRDRHRLLRHPRRRDPARADPRRSGGGASCMRRGSRLADDLHPERLRRHRGDLEGLLDAAHAADVRRQRDPRHHPARRDPGHRHDRQRPSRWSSGWSRSCWPRSTWSAASWSPTGCCRCSCARSRSPPPRRRRGGRLMPTWVQLRLPGLRGLLHPRAQGPVRPEDRAQRQPDRRRRARCVA